MRGSANQANRSELCRIRLFWRDRFEAWLIHHAACGDRREGAEWPCECQLSGSLAQGPTGGLRRSPFSRATQSLRPASLVPLHTNSGATDLETAGLGSRPNSPNLDDEVVLSCRSLIPPTFATPTFTPIVISVFLCLTPPSNHGTDRASLCVRPADLASPDILRVPASSTSSTYRHFAPRHHERCANKLAHRQPFPWGTSICALRCRLGCSRSIRQRHTTRGA